MPNLFYSSLPRSRKSQAALSLVFLIGGISIFIGITLAFLAVSFLASSYGFQAAQRATAVARAGVNDAILQLIRNRDFSNTTGYTVPVGSDTATVTVTQNTNASQATIVSTATVLSHTRKLQIITSVTSSTGQVSIVSWQEL